MSKQDYFPGKGSKGSVNTHHLYDYIPAGREKELLGENHDVLEEEVEEVVVPEVAPVEPVAEVVEEPAPVVEKKTYDFTKTEAKPKAEPKKPDFSHLNSKPKKRRRSK